MTQFSLGSFGSVSVLEESPSSWFAPSSREMALLDEQTVASGVSSLELMERAGGAVVDALREVLKALPGKNPEILVLCGSGNNGGDGLVIARRLADDGQQVVAVLADASRYSTECLAQVAAYRHAVTLKESGELARTACEGREISWPEFIEKIQQCSVIIDALLGTGQREAPRGAIARFVEAVVEEKVRRPEVVILSVDIPTGVDADTGALYTPHIIADYTVSIELLKRGMVQFPGRGVCGAIRVVPIGISGRSGVEFCVVEGSGVPRLRRRSPDTHKGNEGRVLVVAGSAAMPGASALAVLGALRAGAGLVSRVIKAPWTGVEVTPECMHVLLPGTEPHYVEGDCAELAGAFASADVVILGPGLGRSSETAAFVKACLNSLQLHGKRCVVDADALALIGSFDIATRGLSGVVTPHPGEAALLLGRSTAEVQGDRFATVQALYQKLGVVSLLKGAGTVVWNGSRGGIIARGVPYLATAGSGDVLTGILAMCLTRFEDIFEATVCGAYIHAVAGERAARASGGPIIASDVAWAAASVVGELQR